MLFKGVNRAPSFEALLKRWRRARSEAQIQSVAVQTAAALACVNDVPSEVLGALDRLLSYTYEGTGEAIYTVVSYLQTLQRMDRMVAEKPRERARRA